MNPQSRFRVTKKQSICLSVGTHLLFIQKSSSQENAAISPEGDQVTSNSLGILSPIKDIALGSGLRVINRVKVKVSMKSN